MPIANWKGRKAVIDYCIGVVDNTTVESSRALDMHVDESAAGLQRSNITSNQVKVSISLSAPKLAAL